MTLDKWDHRFLRLAVEVSTWSKDPSTQCGAVIVRPDRTIASLGFNGFPSLVPDQEEVLGDREEKYKKIIHSEMNALLFLRESCRTGGYSIYVWPMVPCVRCMAHIIQAGILDVVAPITTPALSVRWQESIDDSIRLIGDAGGRLRGPVVSDNMSVLPSQEGSFDYVPQRQRT